VLRPPPEPEVEQRSLDVYDAGRRRRRGRVMAAAGKKARDLEALHPI
jgi:hypothetical protein